MKIVIYELEGAISVIGHLQSQIGCARISTLTQVVRYLAHLDGRLIKFESVDGYTFIQVSEPNHFLTLLKFIEILKEEYPEIIIEKEKI